MTADNGMELLVPLADDGAMTATAQAHTSTYTGIAFFTEWNTPLHGAEPDPERHAAYEALARDVANSAMPWLLPLLAECGAKVLAGPWIFSFALSSRPGVWLDVPEIADRLQLLPWAEATEVAH